MSDVTQILKSMQQAGSPEADDLLPVVYEQLRELAARKMARESPNQTLQATALVHEAWLRLTTTKNTSWENRAHFYAAAAIAMRRVLIDIARRKTQIRRGGQQQRVSLDGLEIAGQQDQDLLLQVHEVLDNLAAVDPIKARVVELRFFVGLSNREIAELLDVSERTVERAWVFAKAWLFAAIREDSTKTTGEPSNVAVTKNQ